MVAVSSKGPDRNQILQKPSTATSTSTCTSPITVFADVDVYVDVYVLAHVDGLLKTNRKRR
jgi:hypothetical protein